MKSIWKIAAPLIAAAVSGSAFAWDGVVTGTISSIHSVSGEPGNFETRVFINGQTICSAAGVVDGAWGYLNSSDANYKGTLAVLLTAYSLGKNVILHSMKEAGGYCHIHYVVMQ